MLIIRKLRLQRGWSQADLAQFSGLSVRTVQRVEKGARPGLETIKSLAAVFDLDPMDLQKENDMNDESMISREEKDVLNEVRAIKGFYGHLIGYLVCIGGMFLFNYLLDPSYIWAVWPALGWGLGVAYHGFSVFSPFTLFGPEWEKRQVEKRLGRKL